MPSRSEPPHAPQPETEPFRCEVSCEDGTATVRAIGELDLVAVPVLDDQLAELRDAGFRRLILDLRGLYFMDSTGLHCILKYDSLARNNGFSIELIQGPRAVRRVFELTGTATHLPFIDA
jgi:anti-sigma B factor antagonist